MCASKMGKLTDGGRRELGHADCDRESESGCALGNVQCATYGTG